MMSNPLRRRFTGLVLILVAALLPAALTGCATNPKRLNRPAPMRTVSASAAATMDQPVTGAGVMRVGAWNIEHFGSPNSRAGVGHEQPQDVSTLADAIGIAGVDVLAVEEVYVNSRRDDGTWQSDALDGLIGELDTRLPASAMYGWQYLVFDNASTNDKSQLCGVVWNWNAIENVWWWTVPVEGGTLDHHTLWDRRPHAAQFSTGADRTDFVVVPLHMKAGDGFKAHRGVEADQLVVKLDDLQSAFSDKDIILIGDTNCGAATEQTVTAFTSAGFDDANGGATATVPWGNPLDRAFLTNDSEANQEFNGDFVVISGPDLSPPLSETEFRKNCSDHFLVYTTITLMDDDD